MKKVIKLFLFPLLKLRLLGFSIFTALFPAASPVAQVYTDSLEFIKSSYPFNTLSSVLDKQLNTYGLRSRLLYSVSAGKMDLSLNENFNSTYVRSSDKSIRDEQYLTLSGFYRINENIGFGLRAHNNILSDNRKIELNQASASYAALYSELSPYENIVLTPFFGYTGNRQIGENDYGLMYGGEGKIDNADILDMNISSELKFRREDISPRRNDILYYNLLLRNNFDNNISNEINARYSQNRKDFYYSADSVTSSEFNVVNNIQNRTESNYLIQDRLRTRGFLDLFHLDLLGKVLWRSVDRDTRYRSLLNLSPQLFDTKINEVRFEVESNAGLDLNSFNGLLRLIYSERNEKHITKNINGVPNSFYEERSRIESNKDNYSVRTAVSLSGTFEISAKDIFSFNLLQNKLRYDTQSPANFDDRDELLSIVRLRYLRRFTPYFSSFVGAEASMNHIVYIFSEKSSNNNINRIIRLEAGGYYSGKKISSFNSFEVSANYTVYDFESLNPASRSFSFRQFTAVDSTRILLSRKLFLYVYAYLKLSEQGDFKWGSFSTRPARFLEEIFSEPKITYKYYDLHLSLGMRYFSLINYNFKGKEKIRNSTYNSIGPLIDIFLLLNGRLYLKVYGWYEFINVSNEREREQANLSFVMNWNF